MSKSFLLIRYSSLGDVVLATSAVENIANNIPDARISFLTKPQYAEIFYNNPNITEIFTRPPLFQRYDYIIDLHNSLRSNIHKLLIYSSRRHTYNKAAYARRAFLLKKIRNPVLDKDVIERYLGAIKDAGLKTKYVSPRIYLTGGEEEQAKRLTQRENYIAIAPGAKWKTKQWIEEYYCSLTVKIVRDLGVDVVLVGDKNDEEVCRNIVYGSGILKRHIVNLAGKTSVRILSAVLKKAKVSVTTDSAPLHIGRAVESKVVAIFGPTVKEFGFQPREQNACVLEKDMDCRPCSLHGSNKCRFKDKACMKRIEPYEVFNAIKKIAGYDE